MPQPCSLPVLGCARPPWHRCQQQGTKHTGWQGGVEGSSLILKGGLVPTSILANLSWRPPRPHTLSTGDLKHFDIQAYLSSPPPLSPIPTCPEMLPQGLRVGGRRAVPSRGAVAVPWGASGARAASSSPARLQRLLVAVVVGRGSPFRDRHAIGSAARKPSLGDWVTGTRITKTSEI